MSASAPAPAPAISLAPTPAAPPPGTGAAPPGAPPGGPPFQSALKDHSARTALAEGHQQSPPNKHRPATANAQATVGLVPAETPPVQPTTALGAASATAAATRTTADAPQPAATVPATPAATTSSTKTAPATTAATTTPTESTPDTTANLSSATLSGAPSAPAANMPAAARSANPTAASPPAALPLPTSTRETPHVASARDAQPRLPGDAPATASPPAAVLTAASSTPARSAAHTLSPGAPGLGSTTGASAGVSVSAGAAPAADSLTPPTSAAPLSGQAGAVPGYGVDLARAIEAVHATIELATRQGLSSARIALAPAELGEIRIHLSQSASGLVARLTADTPAAAQALSEGRAELRQSLDSLGLTALHLDTGAFQSGAQGREGHAPQHSAGFAPAHRTHAEDGDEDPNPDPLPDPTPVAPRHSRGALVDVLA